jgi:serine/threonine protein kinase
LKLVHPTQNILIKHGDGGPPELKIADFGLSRSTTIPVRCVVGEGGGEKKKKKKKKKVVLGLCGVTNEKNPKN